MFHRRRAARLAALVLALYWGALVAVAPGGEALAATRLALVIGNGSYAHAPLKNPTNDAALVGDSLEASGFEVMRLTDADQRAMKQGVRDFGNRLKQAGKDAVAVFYYAGHGVQVEGRNYLVPLGADLGSAADVEFETIEAQWVLDLIGESRTALSIIILDACRNNPFRSISRSADRGLARMDAPRGSLLAYSTAPGDVALDGTGANSPYSAALAKAMRTPGLKLEEMFKQVRREVLASTGEKQIPWESSSVVGDFYFGGKGAGAPAPQPGTAAAPAPGTVFRDCPDCPEMVSLPGGSFTMGSHPGARGHESVEAPATQVSVRSFAIGRTEVTRGQFAQFLSETGHVPEKGGCWHWAILWHHDGGRSWREPGFRQTDTHPAVCTRYSDARAYAQWLSRKTGHRYRLPSEAEWEYAAGSGTGQAPWGDDPKLACRDANIHDKTGATLGTPLSSAGCDDNVAYTAPAGSFRANGFGLYDMIGNAWEMVDDCWNPSHRGRPSDGASRQTGDCSKRVWKGSNFTNYSDSFRPQFRAEGVAEWPNIYGGFRVAREF